MSENREAQRIRDDEGHPVARDGLRALTEERGSAAAKARTLAALLAVKKEGTPVGWFLVCLGIGLALGALIVLLGVF